MGGGATKPKEKHQKNKHEEARKIQYLIAHLGKTSYLDDVCASILSHGAAEVKDKAEALGLLQEILTATPDLLPQDLSVIMDAVAQMTEEELVLSMQDLVFYVTQAICKHNTIQKAKIKFDELDTDKSGCLEGKEINQVVEWMFHLSHVGPEGSTTYNASTRSHNITTEEEEATRRLMMSRIDGDKDQTLSFPEFLILFQEEQRKSLMIQFAIQKFHEIDKNQSGTIDQGEVGTMVDWLLDLTDTFFTDADKFVIRTEMLNRVGKVDKNGIPHVTLESFIVLCEGEMERLELRRRATIKFKELDVNKSGYLDRQELDKVVDFMYTTLGCGAVRDKEVAKYDLLHRADNNRDGKLNVNEFISLFEQIYLEANKPLEALVHSCRGVDTDDAINALASTATITTTNTATP